LSILPDIKRALGAIQDQLQDVDKKLDIENSRNSLKCYRLRAMKWPFESKSVEKIVASLERHKSDITLALQVDQTYVIISFLSLYNILTNTQNRLLLTGLHRKLDLNKLPQAKGTAYDSYADENEPRCHPDTRNDLFWKILSG
jgi:hypothetical protein